jgi:hypothetical protein
VSSVADLGHLCDSDEAALSTKATKKGRGGHCRVLACGQRFFFGREDFCFFRSCDFLSRPSFSLSPPVSIPADAFGPWEVCHGTRPVCGGAVLHCLRLVRSADGPIATRAGSAEGGARFDCRSQPASPKSER